jgi:hypothetical protein
MVKHRPGFWLVVLIVCGVGGSTGIARAQVSVSVTSSVAITVAAGASISDAGTFTVTNSSGANITISAVNISATGPGIFTSMTLTGQVPGTAAVAVQSSPNPPGTSDTFNFSALPVLPTGQSATFTLSAVATTAVPTPTSSDASDVMKRRMAYAGMTAPAPLTLSQRPVTLLSMLGLGILLMTGQLRRRHLLLLAMAVILAATEAGCGNTTTGATGTSTQAVQTITASSGGTPTGLPANLGSITVQ